MSTRDKVLQEVLNINNYNVLLELPTGFGKTRLAIERTKKLKCKNILLIVNRVVHKDNWLQEFDKWWKDRDVNITMTTYNSLPKYASNYDIIIVDEAHHLTERCREILGSFTFKYSILLSATINRELKDELRRLFKNLYVYKKSLRNAIEEDVLPDPKVYLVPLNLEAGTPTEYIIKNKSAKGKAIESSWEKRFEYLKQRTSPIKIHCTPKQYLEDLNKQIDYWKKRYLNSKRSIAKNRWLQLCGERLKWLSDKKVPYVQNILTHIGECRTLVFCNNIKQTELLGEYCINSKNKKSVEYLKMFNDGKINHITACNILNESMNLTNCQVGIYANLNSSETIIKQRTGRLLRHKNPVLIIPYFTHTREKELINKMLENYNPKLVYTVNNYKDIKI